MLVNVQIDYLKRMKVFITLRGLILRSTRARSKITEGSLHSPKISFLHSAEIMTTLSRTLHGGFVYGLPELFFDVALLWRPTSQIDDWETSRSRSSPPVYQAGHGLDGMGPFWVLT